MLLPLSIPDNMHALLRMLYDDMMPLCGHMTRIASAIAGLALCSTSPTASGSRWPGAKPSTFFRC